MYENYADFREQVSKIPGYRILAINRGEAEKFLTQTSHLKNAVTADGFLLNR